ncbi:Nn.00g080290.m01.CDS01 [Neocucurbitaria sp. VM-36]
MVFLFDIPAELLEEILSPLSIDDLSRLSRTCTALHKFLSPHVYRTIDWYWEDNHPCPPYHLLLRTLLSSPHLAGHVKTIKLRGGGIVERNAWKDDEWNDTSGLWSVPVRARSIWTDGQRSAASFNTADMRRVRIVVLTIDSYRVNEWMHGFQEGNVDLVVALLLHQTQSIELLDLGIGLIQYSKFIPKTFRSLIDSCITASVYPHLMVAKLGHDGPRTPKGTWANLDLFRLFFFLPKLVHLDTVLLEPVVFGWPSPTLTPKSKSLSKLVLEKSTAPEMMLERMLRCTPNLRHLVYDYTRLVAYGAPHWESFVDMFPQRQMIMYILIHCQYLSKALAHVKDTLESLVFKIQFDSDYYTDLNAPLDCGYICGLVGRVKILNQMLRLKNLEISWALLMGWQPSLPWDTDVEEPNFHRPGISNNGTNTGDFPWASILPPNIERLRLRDDLSDLEHISYANVVPVELVEQLLRARRSRFVHLVRLDFHFIWTSQYDNSRRRAQLQVQLIKTLLDICHNDGIECDIVREDYMRKVTNVIETELIY